MAAQNPQKSGLPVIEAHQLGKCYRSYPRQRDRLLEWITPGGSVRHQQHWALKDVSFSMAAGESIAVIGQNGAGKSTLLKLLTGVIRPNAGQFALRGRLRGLLELGLGFHPEFTGMENLKLAGQLQGLTAREVDDRMDWILEFADIGESVHEPVRTYSSGMQMRLAFAVAVAIRPDVLIVDEALSVGDIFFQQKCFELISGFVEQGTSLLFVTHGMQTAYHLCQRALLLEHGRLVFDGPVQQAIDLYESSHLIQRTDAADAVQISDTGSMQSDSALLECIGWRNAQGQAIQSIDCGEEVRLLIRFRMTRPAPDPHVGFKVRNKFGVVVFETNTYCQQIPTRPAQPGDCVETEFSFRCDLVEGEYNVTLGMACEAFGEGSFSRQLWYAHGLAKLVVRRVYEHPLWDGFVNLRPQIQHRISKASDQGQ